MSFNDGFPEAVIVGDLVVSPSNRMLRVATHSNGVYERKLLSGTTDVSENVGLPAGFILEQNYPNPFNPSTHIKFQIPESGFASLKVFDVSGREVATLINEVKRAGNYEIRFNAEGFSSGIYIYQLVSGSFALSKKMLLLK